MINILTSDNETLDFKNQMLKLAIPVFLRLKTFQLAHLMNIWKLNRL